MMYNGYLYNDFGAGTDGTVLSFFASSVQLCFIWGLFKYIDLVAFQACRNKFNVWCRQCYIWLDKINRYELQAVMEKIIYLLHFKLGEIANEVIAKADAVSKTTFS